MAIERTNIFKNIRFKFYLTNLVNKIKKKFYN